MNVLQMKKPRITGRNPTAKERIEAERSRRLHPLALKTHPSSVPADPGKLTHINTYGSLPEHYVDLPFTCRKCGKREIWKAKDQKWYYEESKGHIDAIAVECHDCRKARKSGGRDRKMETTRLANKARAGSRGKQA